MKKIDKYFFASILVMLFYFTLILIWIDNLPAILAEKAVTQCPIDHHEYQIELEFDTILIYDSNRFVGSYYIVGDSLNQFETILADDNR